MMRLALLPPAHPSPWWRTLAADLASDPAVDVLWVADEPPPDDRLGWLSRRGEAPAPRRDEPTAGTGRRPPGSLPSAGAGIVVDIDSPFAAAVAGLAGEAPLVAVAGRADLAAPGIAAPRVIATGGEVLAELVARGWDERRIVAVELAGGAVGGTGWGPAAVPPPGGLGRSDEAGAARSADRDPVGAPTVAVAGGGLSDVVRQAWAAVTTRWPDAVLVADVDVDDRAARARILRRAHVALVLDAAGTALIDALASGATVVAHGDAHAAAVVTHGADGLLTDARDAAQLAGTLEYAIAYHDELAAVRAAGVRVGRGHGGVVPIGVQVLDVLADTASELASMPAADRRPVAAAT